jgi:hypothetical protein
MTNIGFCTQVESVGHFLLNKVKKSLVVIVVLGTEPLDLAKAGQLFYNWIWLQLSLVIVAVNIGIFVLGLK